MKSRRHGAILNNYLTLLTNEERRAKTLKNGSKFVMAMLIVGAMLALTLREFKLS
jgi:hypothetical protein